MQGANDPRVPLSEAAQIYEKAKANAEKNGLEAWYMVASDAPLGASARGFHQQSNTYKHLHPSIRPVPPILFSIKIVVSECASSQTPISSSSA